MVKTRFNYQETNSLETPRNQQVVVQQNFITSNLPNIYTIFSPDSNTHLVELSDAAH
jgi:hypothetical protein